MIYVLVWFELLRQSAFLSTSSLICHIWGATALGWASGSKRGYYENSKYDDKDDDDDGGGVPCDPWVRVADRDNLALCTTWPGTQHHHENMSRIAPLSVGFMIIIINTVGNTAHCSGPLRAGYDYYYQANNIIMIMCRWSR